jgi:DnaJ-class molecular chaperone
VGGWAPQAGRRRYPRAVVAPASDDATGPSDDQPECSACRGTGHVVSGLGGEPTTVTCPWCEGAGRFDPEHDAQAAGRKLRGEKDEV